MHKGFPCFVFNGLPQTVTLGALVRTRAATTAHPCALTHGSFSCLDFIPLVFIVRELLLCFSPGHIFGSQNLECTPQPSLLCSLQLSFFALWSVRPWCHTDLRSQHLKFYTGFRNGHSKAALVTTASLLSSGWVSRAQRHGVFRRSH